GRAGGDTRGAEAGTGAAGPALPAPAAREGGGGASGAVGGGRGPRRSKRGGGGAPPPPISKPHTSNARPANVRTSSSSSGVTSASDAPEKASATIEASSVACSRTRTEAPTPRVASARSRPRTGLAQRSRSWSGAPTVGRQYEEVRGGTSSDRDEDPAASIGEARRMHLKRHRRHRNHTVARVAGALWMARFVWRGLRY